MQNILMYSISHQDFTKYRCMSLMHKKQPFPLRTLSIQSNAIRIKERTRHIQRLMNQVLSGLGKE